MRAHPGRTRSCSGSRSASRVQGTWFRVFDRYDVPIFFAILTMIPGLVFFTIETETSFYPRLRQFLRSIGKDTWTGIIRSKQHDDPDHERGHPGAEHTPGDLLSHPYHSCTVIGHALFGSSLDVSALRMTLGRGILRSRLFLTLMIFSILLRALRPISHCRARVLRRECRCKSRDWHSWRHADPWAELSCGGSFRDRGGGVLLALSVRRIDRTLFARAAGIAD